MSLDSLYCNFNPVLHASVLKSSVELTRVSLFIALFIATTLLTSHLSNRLHRNQTVPVSTNQPPTYWKHQEGMKIDTAVAVLHSMWTVRRHLLSLSEPETTRICYLLQLFPIQLHLISYVSTAAPDIPMR